MTCWVCERPIEGDRYIEVRHHGPDDIDVHFIGSLDCWVVYAATIAAHLQGHFGADGE